VEERMNDKIKDGTEDGFTIGERGPEPFPGEWPPFIAEQIERHIAEGVEIVPSRLALKIAERAGEVPHGE
jgi:hypothetical protein